MRAPTSDTGFGFSMANGTGILDLGVPSNTPSGGITTVPEMPDAPRRTAGEMLQSLAEDVRPYAGPHLTGGVLNVGKPIAALIDYIRKNPVRSAQFALENSMAGDTKLALESAMQAGRDVGSGQLGSAAYNTATAAGAAAAAALPFVGAKMLGLKTKLPIRPARENLPTDEASRMARAREMGFDVDAYHYSRHADDITEFNDGHENAGIFNALGVHSGTQKAASDRAENVRGYDPITGKKEGVEGITYPLKLRGERELLGEDGKPMRELELSGYLSDVADRLGVNQFTDDGVAAIRDEIWKNYDRIPYINIVEDAESVSYISPPKNIRSRFAQFDPAKAGSADILAGLAGLGVLGAGASASVAPGTD
jgi:hypothetical protein